ncbi:MAG: metallophosphoesterase family protein [Bacteroidota bacterium]
MKIGVISDTHSYLDPQVYKYFEDVDEIWHAGDIGSEAVLDQLSVFKPSVAVWGNVDGNTLRESCREMVSHTRMGLKIAMIHIAGKSPRYNQATLDLIKTSEPNLLICGHSHILKVAYDQKHQLLYVNPGAAGKHGFHHMRTILKFEIENGRPVNMKAIELGKRGQK